MGDSGKVCVMEPSGDRESAALRPMLRYPSRSWFVFLAFLAFVVARYIQIGARRDFLASMRFEFLLGGLVTVLVIWQISERAPRIGRAGPLLAAITMLFFAMLIELPLAADPYMAEKVFMDRVIKFAFLTFFMVVMIESPRYLQLFVAAYLFSIFYVTLEAVRGLITGGLIWENQGTMRLHGAVPIYAHPNSLGGVALGPLPFIAQLLPLVRRKLLKLGLLALTVTCIVCIVASGSRTAYIGLLVFAAWWFTVVNKKWKFVLWGLVVLVIGSALLPVEYWERFESITGEEKDSHSKEARIEILEDAWVILMENPLGVGVASFPRVRQMRFGRSQDTHNLYLEVATNLGWQGLAVFITLVGTMLGAFRRNSRAFEEQIRRLVLAAKGRALAAGMRHQMSLQVQDLRYVLAASRSAGGFIIIRLALGLFGMDLYEVYWWFGAGLAIALSGLAVSTQRKTSALLSILHARTERA